MKRIVCLIVLGLIAFNQAIAKESGGGTVVGNGAGIVESNFQLAYLSLPKIISTCLEERSCALDREERKIARDIHSILKLNSNKKDRLIFLSEKEYPGFFTTGANESYRVAKTELNGEAPIYVNTDMLYDKEGNPALNFAGVLRILVHELGHQTGIIAHGVLDILGSKIANFSEENTNYYRYIINEEAEKEDQESLYFAVANYDTPLKTTMLMFNWKNSHSEDLTNAVIISSECKYSSESYAGIELFNGHFSFDQRGLLSFNAWVKLSCFESFSGATNIYKRNLKVVLDHNYLIQSLSVE